VGQGFPAPQYDKNVKEGKFVQKAYMITSAVDDVNFGEHWEEGATYEKPISCFTDIRIATIMRRITKKYPMHYYQVNPEVWEVQVGGCVKEIGNGIISCTEFTIIKNVQFSNINLRQIIKFAIWCALEVCKDEMFICWAKSYLLGMDTLTLTELYSFEEYVVGEEPAVYTIRAAIKERLIKEKLFSDKNDEIMSAEYWVARAVCEIIKRLSGLRDDRGLCNESFFFFSGYCYFHLYGLERKNINGNVNMVKILEDILKRRKSVDYPEDYSEFKKFLSERIEREERIYYLRLSESGIY